MALPIIQLDGVALVTGAGGTIGSECAFAIAQAGAKTIIFADMDKNAATAAATESSKFATNKDFTTLVFEVDCTIPEEVEKLKSFVQEKCGRLDYAVNSVGVENGSYKKFEEVDVASYDDVMNVDARATMLCMRAELGIMAASQTEKTVKGRHGKTRSIGVGGSIVNIASANAHLGLPHRLAYTAAKHSMLGMMKVAALEYADKGIRINTVSPIWIWSKQVERELQLDPNAQTLSAVKSLVPLKRMGEPEEVADYVAFLCSPSASYINGTSLIIDAGMCLNVLTGL